MSSEMVNTIIEFDQDITDMEKPPAFPVGDYPATIQSAENKLSKNSGKPIIEITMLVMPENYPADFPVEIEPEGVRLTHYLAGLDKQLGMYRLSQFCKMIDAPTGSSIDLSLWIGKDVNVTVIHDTYNGEVVSRTGKVSGINN